MRERIYLNNDWLFTDCFQEKMIFELGSSLESVRLPHSVVETPFHYFDEAVYQMISGYQRSLYVPQDWENKILRITFEGVAHDCEVYFNGDLVGKHHCGYTAFTIDLTEHAKFGKNNLLTLKVDSREDLNVPPFGFVVDYMTYGGIYRDVYLDVSEKEYLVDVFQYSEILEARIDRQSGKASSLLLNSEISVQLEDSEELELVQWLEEPFSNERKCVWRRIVTSDDLTLTDTDSSQMISKFTMSTELRDIRLWSPEEPTLYQLCTCLYKGNRLIDEREISFGFRRIEFREEGFFLNGSKYKIRGLNRHQSFPYVGYAMPKSMQVLDADILKSELGVNAVRTSHYPQSHYFLNRCDEIGLLVFTEIPGWQHIGNEVWKEQAVVNTREMVLQYRNHCSIILWGVRINESQDDDAFYKQTNMTAHELDPSRPTGGVRAHKNSSLLEDVYTYNDFVHDGKTKGCEPKGKVTSDEKKPYLVSEYNGHMFPAKAYDAEEHLREHAIRHANVLNAVAGEADIAGSFGWCMFDYNTHKDFGSGDRICYHGVMDMFRNPKPAAAVYASQQEDENILTLSSSMDIGEHPGCNRGATWIYTNADSVRMYKNERFIKEYLPKDSPYRNLKHGPIMLDDFIGNAIEEEESFTPTQARDIKEALNAFALYGFGGLPKRIYLIAAKMILLYHMKMENAVTLFNKYVGDWGGASTTYRFEGYKNGMKVNTLIKEPAKTIQLSCRADHVELVEENSYDIALIRIEAKDQNGNRAVFFQEPIELVAEGDIQIIGPNIISLQGGMSGTYVKTLGKEGRGRLVLKNPQTGINGIDFTVKITTTSKKREKGTGNN